MGTFKRCVSVVGLTGGGSAKMGLPLLVLVLQVSNSSMFFVVDYILSSL